MNFTLPSLPPRCDLDLLTLWRPKLIAVIHQSLSTHSPTLQVTGPYFLPLLIGNGFRVRGHHELWATKTSDHPLVTNKLSTKFEDHGSNRSPFIDWKRYAYLPQDIQTDQQVQSYIYALLQCRFFIPPRTHHWAHDKDCFYIWLYFFIATQTTQPIW